MTFYHLRMDTTAAIRRANLQLLLEEVGPERGAAARLARLTGVKPPIISQLKKLTYYPNGVERTMGDDIARKLESGMGKPKGWMDHPHAVTRDGDELEFLQVLRLLTPEQKEHLSSTARLFAKSNGNPAGPEDSASEGDSNRH